MKINKKEEKELYRKLYWRWRRIKRVCLDPNHENYKYYGGKGVKVCDKWKTFEGFLEEIDKVKNFDKQGILENKISLDKDISGLKEYSIKGCVFISKEENNKYKPNQQKRFIAISPKGIEYNVLNQSEFSKEHNLKQPLISECLKGKRNQHKGWKFKLM